VVKSIDWINRQPPAMKERANSADLIVRYYLQASRRTDLQREAPISGETFREDLKHLAQDLKQFEEPFAPPPVEHVVRREPPAAPATRTFEPRPEPPRSEPTAVPRSMSWTADARSLTVARELQERLNLSNEGEALRLLITLGAERARELFP
jgi:hypothetical protein